MKKQSQRIRHFLLLCISAVFLCASCAYQYEPLVKDKRLLYYHNVHSTVVIPFLDQTRTPGVAGKVTECFTEELARFGELAVVHSTSVAAYLRENNIAVTEKNVRDVALRIARAFHVETAVIGAVTEFNAFFPPKLGLSFEVIRVRDEKSIIAVSETYDAAFNYVRDEAEAYAGLRDEHDSVFGREIVLRKMDLYIEFVCYRLIKKNL